MEIELKLHLEGPAEAEALVSFLGAEQKALRQENVYFDTARGAVSSLAMAVRLRREAGRLLLTAKSSGRQREEFVERGEWERELSGDRWTELKDGGIALRAEVLGILDADRRRDVETAMGDDLLEPVGSMQNHRRRFALAESPARLLVELDRTVYPDGSVVFEVEMEIDDPQHAKQARERLRAAFERAGVRWRPSKLSKRERLEIALRAAKLKPRGSGHGEGR